MDLKNLSVVRQAFANTVFTHKIQEIAVEVQEKKLLCVKIINIIIVTLILFALFLQTFYPNLIWIFFIGAGLTIGEVIFLIFQLTFNFDKRMDLHKRSALKFMALRDSYISLITDIMNENISAKEIKQQREKLKIEYHSICESAPQTNRKEFHKAQKRLSKVVKNEGEDFTWSDEEINHFLPGYLWLNSKDKK